MEVACPKKIKAREHAPVNCPRRLTLSLWHSLSGVSGWSSVGAVGITRTFVDYADGPTYSFNIARRFVGNYANGYIVFLVVCADSLFVGYVGLPSNPVVYVQRVFTNSNKSVTSATYDNATLTLTFNAKPYGGVSAIWFN